MCINKLFGWYYIYWQDAAIARIRIDAEGNPYYIQYYHKLNVKQPFTKIMLLTCERSI